MNKWILIILIISILSNLCAIFIVLKLWQHRKNAVLAWAATEEWVGEQNKKTKGTEVAARSDKIVLLGASITQRFDQNKYFEGEPFINCGVNGHLSGQYLLRFKITTS